MTEQFNTTEARAMLDEIERLRTALGLQDGETLVSGTNGSFLIDTRGGDRRRIGLMAEEYRELERLRAKVAEYEQRERDRFQPEHSHIIH